MSEPEARADSNSHDPNQLEMLERFERFRRTWELELLVSGAVIFALLGVPGRLSDWYFGIELHASRDQFMPAFFAYYYFQLIAYSLIISLFVNLVMRAYWIGLIGLNKVFPEGIRWDKVKDGPISQRVSRESMTLQQLITKTDHVCSLIFSSSFFSVILFVYSIILVSAAGLVAWGISSAFFDGEYMQRILFIELSILIIPPALCGLFDRTLLKKPEEAWKDRWYVTPIYRIIKVFSWMSLRPLYAPIQMTLTSNVKSHVTTPLFMIGFFGLIGYFMVSHFWQISDRLTINGYTMFPDVAVERSVDHRHYENLLRDDEVNRWAPTIQSDMIVEERFVRLFIPYSPFVHDRKLDKICPGAEPVPRMEFFSRTKFNRHPPPESTDAALDCLASMHDVYLNDVKLEPQYDFRTRSDSGLRGIVTYIPIDELPKGRNALRIERVKIEDEDDSDDSEEDEIPKQIVYYIPFWV